MALPVLRAAGAKVNGATNIVTPPAPTGLATGDLEIMVATTIAGGGFNITTVGGSAWTLATNAPVDVTGGEKLYVWWRVRQAGDSDPSIQPTPTGSGDHTCACRIAYQAGTFDATTPLEISTAGTQTTSTTTFSFAPGTTTGGADRMVLVFCSSGVDSNTPQGGTNTANSSLGSVTATPLVNFQTNSGGGGGFWVATGTKVSAGTVGTWTQTLVSASPQAYLCFAIRPASTAVTGAAAITGAGALSGTATRKTFSVASATGAGALTATGRSTRLAASALTGAGTLSASGTRTKVGAAALTGTGSLTAAARASLNGAASLSGAGALAADGTVAHPKLETLTDNFAATLDLAKWSDTSSGANEPVWDSGGGGRVKIPCINFYNVVSSEQDPPNYDLTDSYVYAQVTPAPLSGTREFIMDVIRDNTLQERLTFYVSGNASGNFNARKTVGGSHTGIYSADYDPVDHAWWRIREAGGTIYWDVSADGTSWNNVGSASPGFAVTECFVQFVSGYYGSETAADAYLDNVNVPPPAIVTGAAALTGSGALTATGVRAQLGAAALSGTGALAATGTRVALGVAALAGAGALTATGTPTRFGVAALTGLGVIAATGTPTRFGAAALSGSGALAATATSETFAAAPLTGAGTLTATGTRTSFAAAALTGAGALSATGTHTQLAAATLSGTGTASASGVRAAAAAAALTGTGTLEASYGGGPIGGSAALDGTGVLTATGVRTAQGAVALTGSGALAATGARTTSSTATLAGSGALSAASTRTTYATAALSGTGTLTASGLVPTRAAAALTGTGALSATATRTVVAAATLYGFGTLTTGSVSSLPPGRILLTHIGRFDRNGHGRLDRAQQGTLASPAGRSLAGVS